MLHFGASITHCVAIFLVHTTSFWDRHQMMYTKDLPLPPVIRTPQIYSQMYSTYTHPSNQHGCMIHDPFKYNTRGCCFVKYSLTPSTYPTHFHFSFENTMISASCCIITPPSTPHTHHKSFIYIVRKLYWSAWHGGGVTNPSMRGCDLHPNNTSQNEDVD